MSYGTETQELSYRWSQVCGVFFHRYPNPWSKHVLSDDVISREVNGNVIRTVRVIVKKNKIPRMFTSMFSGRASDGLYIEESYINRDTKTILSYTRTASHRSLGLFDERCTYTPSTNNNGAGTTLKREAWATGYGRAFFTRPLERFVINRYRSEAKKSSKGLNYVLEQFYGSNDTASGVGGKLFPKVVPLLKNMPSLPKNMPSLPKNMPTLPKKIIACEKGQSAEDDESLNDDNLHDEDVVNSDEKC